MVRLGMADLCRQHGKRREQQHHRAAVVERRAHRFGHALTRQAFESGEPRSVDTLEAFGLGQLRGASERARVIDERLSRVLCVDDMPAYSDEAHESVAPALEALPQAQLWFTYKDIQFFFGVSRATVARRLREGLVPGVRMAGSSVVEDAAVRRFDRGQLKWLLLALRHRPRQHGR